MKYNNPSLEDLLFFVFLMKYLTDNEKRVLEFIVRHHIQWGTPPTYQEVANYLDVTRQYIAEITGKMTDKYGIFYRLTKGDGKTRARGTLHVDLAKARKLLEGDEAIEKIVDLLLKLKDLRDSGSLTDEEFFLLHQSLGAQFGPKK